MVNETIVPSLKAELISWHQDLVHVTTSPQLPNVAMRGHTASSDLNHVPLLHFVHDQ